MPLETGTRLGAYEVISLVGAGGMGEVYHARDTRLNRDVAIKVLPDALASNAERLARFQREAQLLAALHHPNIGGIYGLEEYAGALHLVLEYVPGQTLAERLASGPLPLDDALAVCKQIAQALETAHEKGIIHRDLKPANVKITPEGQVKVLDFGLAKDVTVAAAATASISKSPTLASPAETRIGVILGTAAYMSPEQARGKLIDKRADLWAFGCVLYECLSGKQAFAGETVTDVTAAILTREPDWTALPSHLPQPVVRVLGRCLEKDAERRLRDAGDARLELESPPGEIEAVAIMAPSAGRATHRARYAVAAVVALLLIVAGAAALLRLRREPATFSVPGARFVIPLPQGDVIAGTDAGALAISPDGKRLVYQASRGSTRQLFLRDLNRLEATPLAGTEGAEGPFFSPDGQWVGFFIVGKLKRISVSGGSAGLIADASTVQNRGAAWGPDDRIVYSPGADTGLFRVPAAGGQPEPLTALDSSKAEINHRWPRFAGSAALLFTLKTADIRTFDEARIIGRSLVNGRQNVLQDGGTDPAYMPTGHLVFARAGTLLAAGFNPDRLQVTTPPVTVLDGVTYSQSTGRASYSVSNDGTLAYIPGGAEVLDRSLTWVDHQGALKTLAAPAKPYLHPTLSPDGRRIVVTIESAYDDVWVYESARGSLTRITYGTRSNNQWPIWTPDGQRITYSVYGTGGSNLVWKRADGGGSEEVLLSGPGAKTPNSWSPDGKLLLFTWNSTETGDDLWMVRTDGDRKPVPFLKTSFMERSARFSPDGRFIAYASNESGRFEVYVRPAGAAESRWQASTEGGSEPSWSRDGKELFYRNGDQMMSVPIQAQPAFAAGTPRTLFRADFEHGRTDRRNYDVSVDGKALLMVRGQQTAARQINVVLNWFEELKLRVRSGK